MSHSARVPTRPPPCTFLDHEYVEQVRESASLIVWQLGQLKSYIRSLRFVHREPFRGKCIQLLDRVGKKLKSDLARLEAWRFPDNLREALSLHETLLELRDICGYTQLAVTERTEGPILEQSNFSSWVTSDTATNRVRTAVDKLMGFFVRSILPSEVSNEITVIIVFGHDTDYKAFLLPIYLPLIALVHVPKTDLCRSRYWVSLCHETMHLYYDYVEMPRTISSKLGEMKTQILEIGKKVWNVNEPERAENHVEEMVCDFSSLLFCGLPDLLTLLSSHYDMTVDATSFKDHPPLLVRGDYMFRYLGDLEDNSSSQDVSSFKTVLDDCRHSFARAGGRVRARRLKKYTEEYQSFVTSFYDDILDVSKRLVATSSSDLFRPKKWENASVAYDRFKSGEKLVDLDIDVVEAICLIWRKRFDIYQRLGRDIDFSEKFLAWHVAERKIFNDIVDFLVKKA